MRFARIQRILLRDERRSATGCNWRFIFSLALRRQRRGQHSEPSQYQAIDLALEGAIIAGMLGGYVTGLDHRPLRVASRHVYRQIHVDAAVCRGRAPGRADARSGARKRRHLVFSPFVDLNLYRLFRQVLTLNRNAIQPRVVQRAAFNVVCNALSW